MLPPDLYERLAGLNEAHKPAKDSFYADTEGQRGTLLKEVRRARDQLLATFMAPAQRRWPDLETLSRETLEYARRCDWTLIDLVALAAALRVGPAELGRRLASPLLAYQALRMLDDVIDGHLDYKGGYETFYGVMLRARGSDTARGLTICTAAALLAEGTRHLDDPQVRQLHETLASATRELHGIGPNEHLDYLHMVAGKMGAYSSIIYGPVLADVAEAQAVTKFLARTFFVSQVINDLHDLEDDRARGQPNFWLLYPSAREAATAFGLHLDELEAAYTALPDMARPYGDVRLTDLSGYALQAAQRSPETHDIPVKG
ncbi:hypothetical protein BJF79_07045 [Actinomadura sp. CNU-125]|uniref:class 1 isoprenoid biosynthesis enzyme n=1 Tax=Actinomadura sp. CNU-125 TaxID=1904961 RepID=UPI00095AC8B1|nr:class 1 isoprenoid biosynthesis enzyme [Actinomadura sp. CNU-125]OLT35190.1 hypothetical protein BJF79_07045 [Actinomadura sp. CNU-125]